MIYHHCPCCRCRPPNPRLTSTIGSPHRRTLPQNLLALLHSRACSGCAWDGGQWVGQVLVWWVEWVVGSHIWVWMKAPHSPDRSDHEQLQQSKTSRNSNSKQHGFILYRCCLWPITFEEIWTGKRSIRQNLFVFGGSKSETHSDCLSGSGCGFFCVKNPGCWTTIRDYGMYSRMMDPE